MEESVTSCGVEVGEGESPTIEERTTSFARLANILSPSRLSRRP